MKKTIILSIALLAAVLFASCSLQEEPYQQNAEALAKDPDGAEQLVTGIYNTFWSSYMMKKTYQEWTDMDHDLNSAPLWVVSGAGQGNVTTHWGYDGDCDLFNVFYRIINRCNAAKEALEGADLSIASINQRYGEVLFLRAWAYFQLVRMYGPVPLRLTSITEDACPRASIADVYEVIVDDLNKAIEHMYYPSQGFVGGWGHADKTAARILLARVYCTMASGKLAGDGVSMYVDICNQSSETSETIDANPVPNVWTKFTTKPVMGSRMEDGYAEFDAKELYELAKIQCDSVINRRGIDFDLMPEWKQLWGSSNYRNQEFVWGIAGYEMDDDRVEGGPWDSTPTAYGGGNYVAISDGCWQMFDYDINSDNNDARAVDGVFHYWKNGTYEAGKQWYRFPSGDMHYNTAPDGLKPDDSNEYVKDGPRSVTGWYRPAAYLTKHYMGSDISNPVPVYTEGSSKNAYDIILIRFAEAYLLRAEALNELDQPQAACDDLNVIRSRSHAKTYNETDKVLLRSYIFQERGLEFLQEFNRRFDLIRWGMYLNVMNATAMIINSQGEAVSLVRAETALLTAVPRAELTSNTLFGGNNPGY